MVSCEMNIQNGIDIVPFEGPAGGIVFYDKGKYSDGWRYIEAAPSPYRDQTYPWRGVPNLSSLPQTSKQIGTAKKNTELIVGAYGIVNPTGYVLGGYYYYAARICYEKTIINNGIVYDDWYLPSIDELILMNKRLYRMGLGNFSDGSASMSDKYWSSTTSDSKVYLQPFGFNETEPLLNSYLYATQNIRAVRYY